MGAGSPLGKIIRTVAEPHYPETQYEIVGVVKDTKYGGLREPVPPSAYVPAQQYSDIYYFTNVFVRFSAPPAVAISAVCARSSSPSIRE